MYGNALGRKMVGRWRMEENKPSPPTLLPERRKGSPAPTPLPPVRVSKVRVRIRVRVSKVRVRVRVRVSKVRVRVRVRVRDDLIY